MVVTANLHTKARNTKRERPAARSRRRRQPEKAQQTFYEVLAGYYSGLATDFRKVIEKRTVA